MFIGFLNRSQTALDFTTLLQQIGEAEVSTGSNFMRLRGIQQFESLSKELISGREIANLVTNLRQSNQSLALCLGISARASEVQGFLSFVGGLLRLSALEQEFSQSSMAERGRDFIIEFALNRNGLLIFLLRSIEIVLFLQRFTQALMCQTNQALLIAHLIDGETTHSILTSHNKLAYRFVVIANLHILLSKASAITIHAFERLQSKMEEGDSLLQITEAEVIIGQITEDLKREDRIGDEATLNSRVAAEVVLHS